MAYANYQDLVSAYDANVVAGLCSDSSTPLPGDNAVIQAIIGQAQGKINMSVRVANRYTIQNLLDLELARDPTLIRLTVDIAMKMLFMRRARAVPDGIRQQAEESERILEALRNGVMIFGEVSAAATAGLPTVSAVPLQLLSAYGAAYNSPYYPPLSNQTWPGT
jgi:phage gp36-like protein